ncbi:hypothetical protein HDU83_007632 [Entophlyctis luteolus]|nr:hypothetical protein HDU82_005040 [Entophlyctis luteolus]KAJ3352830.1 hypothetical protein HDU83_007632 [Entophlyctis luteolus]
MQISSILITAVASAVAVQAQQGVIGADGRCQSFAAFTPSYSTGTFQCIAPGTVMPVCSAFFQTSSPTFWFTVQDDGNVGLYYCNGITAYAGGGYTCPNSTHSIWVSYQYTGAAVSTAFTYNSNGDITTSGGYAFSLGTYGSDGLFCVNVLTGGLALFNAGSASLTNAIWTVSCTTTSCSSAVWGTGYPSNASDPGPAAIIPSSSTTEGLLALFTGTSTSAPTSTAAAASSAAAPTTTSTATASASTSSGIPVGAISGGVVAGVVGIAAACLFFWMKARNARHGDIGPRPDVRTPVQASFNESKHLGTQIDKAKNESATPPIVPLQSLESYNPPPLELYAAPAGVRSSVTLDGYVADYDFSNVGSWTVEQVATWVQVYGGGVAGAARVRALRIDGSVLMARPVEEVADMLASDTLGGKVRLHSALSLLVQQPL